MESSQFKVGDRVRALAGGPKDAWETKPCGGSVGKVGTVDVVSEKGLQVTFGPRDSDYARFQFWEKVAESAFKPGDRVKVVKRVSKGRCTTGFDREYFGKTGTVIDHHDDFVLDMWEAPRVLVDFGEGWDHGYPEELESAATKFSPGDVVTLKSGSAPMTVNSVAEDAVVCVWYNGDGDILSRQFSPEALCHVPQ